MLATHNAYWVDRQVRGDLFGSGVSERLLDQLAFEGVRSLELDIHGDDARPGELRVYHTVPGNSLCDSLRDCLGEVRAFAWSAPQHDPITLILELKAVLSANFTAEHGVEDLDRVLREELGPALFTPADLLARCPGDATLSACVARAGWPALAELRGRVLVALLGNWDELGAQATADWVRYATSPIDARAAFPMASAWKLSAAELTPRLAELAPQVDLDRAREQSVFLQIEAIDDPHAAPFLAAGGVVRADGAEGVAAQEQRLALAVQLLQTDTPWLRAGGVGPGPEEPGRRLFLRAEPGESVFAYREGAGAFALQAIVAAGRSPAVGCLRAAADARDAITICREKPVADGGPAESVVITVESCVDGACSATQIRSHEPAPGGVGDLVALVGDAAGCVRARSGRVASPGAREPVLIDVGPARCGGPPLRLRGALRPSSPTASTVGFFGLEGADDLVVQVTDAAGSRLAPERRRGADPR